MEAKVVDVLKAEELKGLGFSQDTERSWAFSNDDKEWDLVNTQDLKEYPEDFPYSSSNIFAAPTAEEVWIQLPVNVIVTKGSKKSVCRHWFGDPPDPLRNPDKQTDWCSTSASSLLFALTKMRIMLHKKGII